MKNCIDSREQFETISRYFSQILSEFEKPKNGGSKTSKIKNEKSKKKEKCNEDMKDTLDNDEDISDNTSNYIKIHELISKLY